MQLHAAAVLLAVSLLESRRASVQVERSKDLSCAGFAHAKATGAVIGHAIDAVIDTSSYKQVPVVALNAKNER